MRYFAMAVKILEENNMTVDDVNFAMAVIRESGNTGKRKAVKNYQI